MLFILESARKWDAHRQKIEQKRTYIATAHLLTHTHALNRAQPTDFGIDSTNKFIRIRLHGYRNAEIRFSSRQGKPADEERDKIKSRHNGSYSDTTVRFKSNEPMWRWFLGSVWYIILLCYIVYMMPCAKCNIWVNDGNENVSFLCVLNTLFLSFCTASFFGGWSLMSVYTVAYCWNAIFRVDIAKASATND